MHNPFRTFEIGQREPRLPAPVILGPLLGLLYFFFLPVAVVICCLIVVGIWVKRKFIERLLKRGIDAIR